MILRSRISFFSEYRWQRFVRTALFILISLLLVAFTPAIILAASHLNTESAKITKSASVDLTNFTVSAGAGNRLLFVWILWSTNAPNTPETISSVTFDPGGGDQAGLSEIYTGTIDEAGYDVTAYVYGLLESDLPASGDYTIRVTFSAATDYDPVVAASLYDGINQSLTPYHKDKVETALDTDPINIDLNYQDPSLLVQGTISRAGGSYTHGTDQQEALDTAGQNSSTAGSYEIRNGSGSGTHTVSADASATTYRSVSIGLSFEHAAAQTDWYVDGNYSGTESGTESEPFDNGTMGYVDGTRETDWHY